MFDAILHPFAWAISYVWVWIHDLLVLLGMSSGSGMAWVLSIVLLTILVRIAIIPLFLKQIRSSRAMQAIQPEMRKIQEKYKNNPQMLQQKTGELFRNAGVNPLAGCLPLLVQMPILMGMYYALFNFTFPSAAAAAFFWLPNMSEPDPLYILPVLSALTTFLQQKMTSTEMNAQMKIMMTVMPLFIGWISLKFPSGLVLYWVTMNVVQIIQQWWMYRSEGPVAKEAI